jgi:phosphoglycerate dehydrogenase-like enzyme
MNILVTELIRLERLDKLGAARRIVYDPDLWRDPQRLREAVRSAHALIVRNQIRVDTALLESEPPLKVSPESGSSLKSW